MDLKIKDVARRIHSLREDCGLTAQEMAEATGITTQEYLALERGEQDFGFTFLYRAADELGVDLIDLLTGESPHRTQLSVVRASEGLPIERKRSFEYLHLAPTFKNSLCEPFLVTTPYNEEEQGKPIELTSHIGQELDYIISGHLRFQYEDHTEDLGPGDTVLYDSSRGHGMIAIDGEPCTFLAVVLRDPKTT